MTPQPVTWVLLGKGQGGNGQMRSLAEALGWPFVTRQLHYSLWSRCPNLLLRASLLGLNRRRTDPLTPPWPDLVIAASRRSAPVALWIKRQSGGRTHLVHLLHTQAPLHWFDLVITMPQYGLPRRPNVLHITAPLNRLAPSGAQRAAVKWEPRLEHLPRPWTALLVGGNSSTYRLLPKTAALLGRQVSGLVRASGGSLLLTTSPRTPASAARALEAAIDVPTCCYRWRPRDQDNPYRAYLALADRFVVTIDSASLLVEACASGRPVQVFEWQRRLIRRFGVQNLLRRTCPPKSPPRKLLTKLVDCGVVKPPRDFTALKKHLQAQGLVAPLGNPWSPPARTLPDDMGAAVNRIRQLVDKTSKQPCQATPGRLAHAESRGAP